MIDMFAVFSIGIVVGMSILSFAKLIFEIREADKELKKDERTDEDS